MDIVTQGDDIVVTGWETNQTNSEPAMRICTDNDMTFGQILKIGVKLSPIDKTISNWFHSISFFISRSHYIPCFSKP